MKFTQVPADTFERIQLNAGVLLTEFDPDTAELSRESIVGATSGGVNFSATPEFVDFGEDIDNVPANTKELKKLDYFTAQMTGSFVTVTAAAAKMMVGAADVSGNKVTPRVDLLQSDFTKIWWVGDYSDKNAGDSAGYIAIEMSNVLSTGGFKIQSGDKEKGTFDFEFTAHYSMADTDKVPFNIYVKQGTTETTGE